MAIDSFFIVAPTSFLEEKALAAGIRFEKGSPRLGRGELQPKGYDAYLSEAIGHTSAADLKMRYSGHRVEQGGLVVAVGPTSFREYRDIFKGDIPDNILAGILKSQGEVAMHDAWARFARPLGVTVAVTDRTGAFVIGKRKEVTEYRSFFHFPAGYVPFTANPAEIDIVDTALSFLRTNYNIQSKDVVQMRPELLAAQPETGETDIVFVARTRLPARHFSTAGSWRRASRSNKYESLQRVGLLEARDFVRTHDVVYGAAALLVAVSQ